MHLTDNVLKAKVRFNNAKPNHQKDVYFFAIIILSNPPIS